MNGCKYIWVAFVLAVLSLSSGCRSGVGVHGRSVSLFWVPMYKQPAGYSSSYRRHLAYLPPMVEQHVTSELSEQETQPLSPPEVDETVIIPTAASANDDRVLPVISLPLPRTEKAAQSRPGDRPAWLPGQIEPRKQR